MLKNNQHFSAQKRNEMLEEMTHCELDILIIGGGITGTGIALDAASRNCKVGLIEKSDFGSGTSSKSGKLIHGGLKYLKTGDLSLVREVGSERAIVHKNARHLVIPVNMLFPIVKNGSFNKVTLKLGLSTYDKLAGVQKHERHVMLSKKEVFEQEPLLSREQVSGGGMYIEYRTDDSRLTMEVAKTAFEHGAYLCNYTKMTDFITDHEGKVIGVIAKDLISGQTVEIYAKYIVNAGGPWVDKVRAIEGEIKGKKLHLTKGIHIVVPFHKFPVNESLYYDVAGRMIAVVPRDGCTYIGSTETDYHGDLDDVFVEQSDVDYLLDCVNTMFPDVNLEQKDITSCWAGLRPLIHEEGKPPSEMSRKDEIFESDSGLITIAGGKLTGYRKMAERVVDYLLNKGKLEKVPTVTEGIKLSGGKFQSNEEVEMLVKDVEKECGLLNIPSSAAVEFVYRYGTNIWVLLDVFKELFASQKHRNADVSEVLAAAEACYAIEHEMAMRLTDFFDRRTGYLLFKRESIPAIINIVAAQFSDKLGWDEKQLFDEQLMFDREYKKSLRFEQVEIK